MVGRRSKRTWVIVAAVVLVVLLAFVGLTLRLFVYPDLNAPVHSDAIVVLGGNGTGPTAKGEQLVREGYADTFVISLNPSQSCSTFAAALSSVKVMCFRPVPSTTQGEGRAIAGLASANHWHRIIVVMPTTQATRARLRVGWCYPGQVLEVASEPDGLRGWVHGLFYEWGALVKALVLNPGC